MLDVTKINNELIEYCKAYILPQYELNEKGHGTEHIEYVLRRCFRLAEQISDIDVDLLYTIAVFHDIGHHIDKKNHEKLSAEMFMKDSFMTDFFNDEERKIIKEAIEDHRASASVSPRSDYGKIISSADRSTDIDEFLRRTHSYTLKHFAPESIDEIIERAYEHSTEKYGDNGYAKHYLEDEEYNQFIAKIRGLLKNKSEFIEYYRSLTEI